jgi:hypothetical protein
MDIFEKATAYAFKCHEEVNQSYDGMPYSFHLDMVDAVIVQFQHLISSKERIPIVRAGGRCHDLLDDARQNYNDVKRETNVEVAELAYAMKDHKGRNRKERHNADYFNGLIAIEDGVYLKLADRIANIKHSKKRNSRMITVYREEAGYFAEMMHLENYPQYKEMIDYMNELLAN